MERMHTVGKLGSSYGVRGWMHLYSFTSSPADIFTYTPLYLQDLGNWTSCKVIEWKSYKDHFVVKLDKISTKTIADYYVNAKLGTYKTSFKELPPNTYYWYELIDFMVFNLQNEYLGKVVDILETGANDVLVVRDNVRERLIPYIDQAIQAVKLDLCQILVDWDKDF